MKPHVICHMVASVDGRTWQSRQRPAREKSGNPFETLHEKLEGDAWLVGRVTGREFARKDAYPVKPASQTYPRTPWIARRDAGAWGIVLDARGKIAWGRSDIGGDPIVVVLTEQVPDAHLEALRGEGVSYLFAGKQELDLAQLLEILNKELGIKRLLLEGGGKANGSFLRAGLVDEISLAIVPTVDGAKGAPHVFDSEAEMAGPTAPVTGMTLKECQMLDGGAVWLRYDVKNG
ncbi:MAG: 2-hydroxy-3-oxopropionate reductase [Rhodospirillales bacterium]|nr:2-hydroxy-3-oxopropionate reductase [Rhodospirillales bacterium]